MEGFVEWLAEEYLGSLELEALEGGDEYQRRLRAFTQGRGDRALAPYTYIDRIQAFYILKFGYPLHRYGYVLGVYTAALVLAGTEKTEGAVAGYAHAYWRPGGAAAESLRDAIALRPGGGTPAEAPEYVSVSSTFDSKDGEYRYRYTWYPAFAQIYEALATDLEPIERALSELVAEGGLVLRCAVFPADAAPSGDADARLPFQLFVALVAVEWHNRAAGMRDAHAPAGYQGIMEAVFARLEALRTPIDAALFGSFAYGALLRHGAPGTVVGPQTVCGEKLFPLTEREAADVGNLNYAPWREAWIAARASDCVIGGVAPGLPLFGNWTYLRGAGREAFESAAVRRRYDTSAATGRAIAHLRAARKGLRFETYRETQFDAHVFEALAYGQTYLALTDLAVSMTSEYLGPTLDSHFRARARAPPYDAEAPLRRLVFDLCYAAHALHARQHVIHADIHLNNMTLYEKEGPPRGPGVAEAYVVYVAGPRGEADTYVFPHLGKTGALIDFSRSLVGPGARARLADEFGAPFAASFYREQVGRALRALHHHVPKFVEENQELVKAQLLGDPGRMFAAMTAIDFVAISRSLRYLLTAGPAPAPMVSLNLLEAAPPAYVAPPGALALLEKVEDAALGHLLGYLAAVRNGEDPGGLPTAGAAVFPAAFAADRFAARPLPAGALLADVYNINAPMRASSSDYARFPAWACLDAIQRQLGGIGIEAVIIGDRGARPFLDTLRLDAGFARLQERLRTRLEDRPAATSSWIE